MLELIQNPWSWYVVGVLIVITMFLLLYFGKEFGVSANLRTMCSIGGAGKFADFFRFDWKSQRWNLIFVVGTILGGWFSSSFLEPDKHIDLNPKTIESLKEMGFSNFDAQGATDFEPQELFNPEELTVGVILYLLIGGVLVGFGSRYAGGCTSGHAISGLSNLQLPSLIAVIGFFIGGLAMVWLIMPHILPF